MQPKDDTSANTAYFGANPVRGLELHKWVTKVNDADKRKGRTVAFPVARTPISWPAHICPSNCVDKMKDGKVRLDKKRQTFNPSSPEPGKYQNLLVRSPNQTIDLEQDFPDLVYLAQQHFRSAIVTLEAIDDRPGRVV